MYNECVNERERKMNEKLIADLLDICHRMENAADYEETHDEQFAANDLRYYAGLIEQRLAAAGAQV